MIGEETNNVKPDLGYKIVRKEELAPNIKLFEIKAPWVAKKAAPGQFIILRVNETGERVPLTIANFNRDAGTVTIIAQEVGYTTKQLGQLREGDAVLDFVGPLGQPSELPESGTVVCIGGGIGIAPIYPQVKALSEQGINVITIVGSRSAEQLILTKDLEELSSKFYVATDDGSQGYKGFVTDILQELLNSGTNVDRVIAIGPIVMMKAVTAITQPRNIPTTVSLNSLMVDGTGMCGACRVTIGGENKFACIDGPEFDAFQVDFDEQLQRQDFYRDPEMKAMAQSHCHIGDTSERGDPRVR
ncbi:MAG: sulfide/dihydroorotate dehydrogenase-like FAD/NAD-binding protein [Clostridiales bacterium]|nr:sulfide/dihydroorotate dehydrogenase-like FAD/NAD-binding protein [Clostridiales bacterium]MCF8022375.1 sulfide/dihydroorotate dehydrogenase-like FAD/NAD-binding protein [Clostridiales bacterium]